MKELRITQVGLAVLVSILSLLLWWLFQHHDDVVPCGKPSNSEFVVKVDDDTRQVTCQIKM